jgi:hypothetical protein
MTNREQSSKGYTAVKDTSAHAFNFYGFSVTTAAVVSAIVAPTDRAIENTAYDGDETGLAALTTLPPGYYPIRGSSITLASGELILWEE